MNRMTRGVQWLLIANTALFLLYFLAVRFGGGDFFLTLTLVPKSVVGSFAIWQLVTYMFLHSPYGFWHILVNMLTLWMFGTPLESVWGTRRFLQFYFFCGVGAGICVVLLNLVFGDMRSRTLGASGAIYGLLLAFGMLFPRAMIYFFGLFPLEARWYVALTAIIVFLSTIADSGGGVSHIAHLGGMVFGFAWLHFGLGGGKKISFNPVAQVQETYKEWQFRRAKKKFQVYLKKQQGGRKDDWIH